MKKIMIFFLMIIIINIVLITKPYHSTIPVHLSNNGSLILVNRNHPLAEDYVPLSLVKVENVDYIKRENEVMYVNDVVLENYFKLYQFAQEIDIELTIFSAYRSYDKQQELWNNVNASNFYLAKPGYSEHQTGLALDISTRNIGLTNQFATSLSYQFLLDNCYKFGFINRYPLNKEHITGYYFEPWHFRYVGYEHALIIHQKNITFEEYLELK